MDDLKPCPLCGALPCDWVDDPHKAEVGLCWTLAKIREVLGVGEKPMLGELPDIIAATLTAQAAEIARLKSALCHVVRAETSDVEIEDALTSEGVTVWGPDGERFDRMFSVVMKGRQKVADAAITGSQSHDKSEGYAREVAEAIKRGGPICD